MLLKDKVEIVGSSASQAQGLSQDETASADKTIMVNFLLAFLSVCLFCGCCHQLIKLVVRPQPALNTTGYNRAALRLAKSYGVFAWGTMTATFLVALVMTFYQVYVQL